MSRETEHAIHPLFLDRWSPRAFTDETIPDSALHAIFEAARWSPSTSNSQPWRFLYGKRGTPAWDLIYGSLIDFNKSWAQHASVLITVISAKSWVPAGKTEPQPLPSHSFDTGAAWQSLALQATHAGWHAHGMGGFDRDALRSSLEVPDSHSIETVVAIGRIGDKAMLSEGLQSRETPSQRRPLAELIGEGKFAFKD